MKRRKTARGRIAAALGAIKDSLRRSAERLRRLMRPSLGRRGENAAARYLRRHGYRILARNFRAAGAEIDLIAMEGDTLVFVEVKTRLGIGAGTPQEAVGEQKQRRIRRAAELYAVRHYTAEQPVRFDVVAVLGQGRGRRLELLKDAF
jgi:putative endonuclease